MFCPVCKAEYRQGFTVCADCEVALVYHLVEPSAMREESNADGSVDRDEDPFCAFWRGDDPRIHAELCELLEHEGIPHKTVRREDHLFILNSRSAFQLGVPFSLFEKAEAVIKEAYGTVGEPEDVRRLLPSGRNHAAEAGTFAPWLDVATGYARMAGAGSRQAETSASSFPETPLEPRQTERFETGWDPEKWFEEDATMEVWAGDQPELAEFIAASLQTNQIHSRIDQLNGKCSLFVLPGNEAQAREIVREVVEGIPPE
jgi:hypothetical protein